MRYQKKDALPSEKTQRAHRRAVRKMAFMTYNVNGHSHKIGSISGHLKSGILNLRMSIMTVGGQIFPYIVPDLQNIWQSHICT